MHGFRRRTAQPLGESRYLRRRLEPELLPQPFAVVLLVLEGPGGVARQFQRLHEAQRHSGVVRIVRRPGFPPFHRGPDLAPARSRLGQLLEGFPVRVGQSGTLPVHPTLELSSTSEEEAIEERSGVELYRALELACIERLLEGDHITLHGALRGAQLLAHGKDRSLPQGLPELVDGLVQKFAPVLGVALRPEQGRQFVPGKTPRGGASDEGEESNAVSLCGRTRDESAFNLQRRSTEKLQGNHHATADRGWTARGSGVDRSGLFYVRGTTAYKLIRSGFMKTPEVERMGS